AFATPATPGARHTIIASATTNETIFFFILLNPLNVFGFLYPSHAGLLDIVDEPCYYVNTVYLIVTQI
ncbi:MAG: hypothetical protein K6B39_08165, partial [Lachnospiraceae bacterium]|nr:hypothetical protein [Lachnospiraceae bacterium]